MERLRHTGTLRNVWSSASRGSKLLITKTRLAAVFAQFHWKNLLHLLLLLGHVQRALEGSGRARTRAGPLTAPAGLLRQLGQLERQLLLDMHVLRLLRHLLLVRGADQVLRELLDRRGRRLALNRRDALGTLRLGQLLPEVGRAL